MTGRTIGGYHLQTLLGAGGMGEVYRARDAKLGRDVAIKILPRAVTSDPDRLARFEREARMLAALNHPNICAIYGLEEADGIRFLILERVDGATLAERIAGSRLQGAGSGSTPKPEALSSKLDRALPIGEALAIARQIADGARSGARQRDRPPRPQTRQHQDHAGRRGQSARLRAGEADKRRRVGPRSDRVAHAHDWRHAGRRDSGHRRLHEPGAGARARRSTSERTSGRSVASSTRC